MERFSEKLENARAASSSNNPIFPHLNTSNKVFSTNEVPCFGQQNQKPDTAIPTPQGPSYEEVRAAHAAASTAVINMLTKKMLFRNQICKWKFCF